MRKIYFLLIILAICGSNYAQDATPTEAGSMSADTTPKPKYWVFKTLTGFNAAQTTFTNWSAGGENSVSGNVVANLNATYTKDGHNWESLLQTEYGMMWTPSQKFNKTVDKLFVASKYGYRIEKTQKKNIWLYTVSLDFQTQYDNGYKTIGDADYISTWMAPGYLNASVGIDYHYKNIFSAYMAPLTGRTTFVLDTFLSNRASYGLKNPGDKILAELGFSAKASVNATICKNVTLQSALSLFTPYSKEDFGNFVVDWNVLLLMKVNSFLSATVNTNLKYDDKVRHVDADGSITGPKVQFKEMITVGLVYAFDSTKPPTKRKHKG
ncbi:MAG: DUF3078 domain-containing protein [Bacteroidales bacterium]|jgi:hypothetical protein|nr:DUF3078 domain-containing protein [Bacteroidales bacterium]